MSVSMRDLDPTFKGVGQKAYPVVAKNNNISCCLQFPYLWDLCSNFNVFLGKTYVLDLLYPLLFDFLRIVVNPVIFTFLKFILLPTSYMH